jgi:hypothetical protein
MNTLIGYMDRIDFECEQFQPLDGNRVYASIEDLKEHSKHCINECGIVKVEVKLLEIVEPGTGRVPQEK